MYSPLWYDGLMNFTVFRKQLRIAREQIEHGVRQLEIAQRQPET